MNNKIEEMIEKYKSWEVPFAWFIGPSTQPKNLYEYLEKYKFINTGDWVGMYKELKDLEKKEYITNTIKIVEVDNAEQFNEWGKIVCAGFEIHDYFKEDTLSVFSDLGFGQGNSLRHYIAYYNGYPSSVCTLFLGMKGIAGIYFVATRPEYRGKGIATDLVNYVLNIAKNERLNTSVLQATDMGFSAYKKM